MSKHELEATRLSKIAGTLYQYALALPHHPYSVEANMQMGDAEWLRSLIPRLTAPSDGERIDPDSGRHGPNENRHDVLKAIGGNLQDVYPLYELWRFERLAKDGL